MGGEARLLRPSKDVEASIKTAGTARPSCLSEAKAADCAKWFFDNDGDTATIDVGIANGHSTYNVSPQLRTGEYVAVHSKACGTCGEGYEK
jgi:hypothetical protein